MTSVPDPEALALSGVLADLCPQAGAGRGGALALAFSGGLDSRFLAHAARRLLPQGAALHLFHVRGPHVSRRESREAEAWAQGRGFGLSLLDFDPLSLPEVRANGRERCYFCKKAMFTALAEAASRCPALAGHSLVLCDGSNASDGASYRPGLKALRELGVRSPLALAGLDKNAIRRLAARGGLDRPDQKARPCLLTRFAYGLEPDAAVLDALDRAEEAVAVLLEDFFAAPERPGPEKVAPETVEPETIAPAAAEPETAGRGGAASPPDFRLRLTERLAASAPNAFAPDESAPDAPSSWRCELHLNAPPPDALIPALARRLSGAGFGPAPVLYKETLSGHYDRQAHPPYDNLKRNKL